MWLWRAWLYLPRSSHLKSIFGDYGEARESWDRPLSAHQILENAMSTVGKSGDQGEGTKQWREKWWDIIIRDTIHGPNFWSGRGFGLNIAEEDGFAGPDRAQAAKIGP